MLLTCKNIKKSFGVDDILSNINFVINKGEKVALVGINGAGKSTLFKIITDQLSKDSGDVIISANTSLAYLSQSALENTSHTLYNEVLHAREDILVMEHELKDLETKLASHYDDADKYEAITKQYTNLQHQFELADGYSYYSKIKGILYGLSFKDEDFNRPISTLSGGQKTRLALAKLLITEPDILLLDEPTNHLDIKTTEWLENYLINYKNTLMIISHDRFFLDKVVNKVIEIERGISHTYNGNYTDFIQKKDKQLRMLTKQYTQQQKEIKKQEEVIKQLKSFNREKSIKRAESREKLLNKVTRIEKPLSVNDTMHFTLDPKIPGSNDVLTIEDLSMAFGENTLFNHIDLQIKRGEKIALIGGNGTGKTTLFKILRNQITNYTGQFKLGSKIHIGYYDQEHDTLNETSTLFDEISNEFPTLVEATIRNTLAAFLFTGDSVYSTINTLSGGEKGRLALAKIILSKANFLMLDEPTNHLDIVSKSVLEQALQNYTGTVFFISHDRYFINQVATRVIELKELTFTNYLGDYNYYLEKRDELAPTSTLTTEKKVSTNKEQWLKNKAIDRETKKREKALNAIETTIHEIEDKIVQLDEQLCDTTIAASYEKLGELTKDKESFELELKDLYEKWEKLLEDMDN